MQRLNRLLSLFLSFCLIFEQTAFAQSIDLSHYFANSGKSILQGDKFRPLHLRYISYDTETNDFQILLDKGDAVGNGLKPFPTVEEETKKLMKYFFIGLSLPNEKFWVNLRPDSPDNILDPDLEKTDIGRIFLESDLQLKKDTSGMTSPQTPEGKAYWDKLYKKAGELFGSQNITIPTITRPWIVPGEIIIGESPEGAYIYKATLKVMLEEDYLRGMKDDPAGASGRGTTTNYSFKDSRLKELNEYSTRLIKETIIPKLTYEVNTSKRYAPLRQVYYSLILAQWFKQKYPRLSVGNGLKPFPTLDQLTSKEPYDKQTYFKQYQKSFQDGEYNLQEPVYTPTGQSIRRYMSGGLQLNSSPITRIETGKSINIRPYLISVGSPITDAFMKKQAEILFQSLLSLHKEIMKASPEHKNTILEGWSFRIKDAIADAAGLSLEEKETLGKAIHDAIPLAHKQEFAKMIDVLIIAGIVKTSWENIKYNSIFEKDEKAVIQEIFGKVHTLAAYSSAAKINKDSDIANLINFADKLTKEEWVNTYEEAAKETNGKWISINNNVYNFETSLPYQIIGFRNNDVFVITNMKTKNKFVLKRSSSLSEARIHKKLIEQGIAVPAIFSLNDTLDKKYILMDFLEGENIAARLYNSKSSSDKLKYLFGVFNKEDTLDDFIKNINAINAARVLHNDLDNFKNMLYVENKIVFIDFHLAKEFEFKTPDNAAPLIDSLENWILEAREEIKNNKDSKYIENVNACITFTKSMIVRLSSSPAFNNPVSDKGGIDFSRPEIITRPISGLQSLAGSPLAINPDLNFEAEWGGIQAVFNAGIRPSARRMAEFAASVAASPLNSRRLEDLRGLVTDLLRRDEEDEKLIPLDQDLKKLLANL